ncbi:MAG: YraN family protein [Chitinophagaceae bacterium]|nr:YraN family protein [Chitinophagaceae bacterium]
MASHNDLGKFGEGLAKDYVLGKGFSLLHRNWVHASCEIDLIASKAGVLHFIEVKTRRSTTFGFPEESVDIKKFRNIQKAASKFLYLHPEWKLIQFDILSILLVNDRAPEYFYIEDVYLT